MLEVLLARGNGVSWWWVLKCLVQWAVSSFAALRCLLMVFSEATSVTVVFSMAVVQNLMSSRPFVHCTEQCCDNTN